MISKEEKLNKFREACLKRLDGDLETYKDEKLTLAETQENLDTLRCNILTCLKICDIDTYEHRDIVASITGNARRLRILIKHKII